MALRFGLATLLGAVVAGVAWAQPQWLTPYPHSEQRLEQHLTTDDYTLALAAAGRGGSRDTVRLEGELWRLTWRLDAGHGAEEGHKHWRRALAEATQRVLYRCRGRGCGSSYQWSSQVFGVRELYGDDETQYYDALELMHDESHYVAAIYTVRRGNGRVYSHVDLLALASGAGAALRVSANSIVGQLRGAERMVLAVLADDRERVDTAQVEELVQALRKDVLLRVAVRGVAHGDAPQDELEARARGYARDLRERVLERGIDAGRVTVADPQVSENGTDRVELQRIPRQ